MGRRWTKLLKNWGGEGQNCLKILGGDAHYKIDHRRRRALFPCMDLRKGSSIVTIQRFIWLMREILNVNVLCNTVT